MLNDDGLPQVRLET